MAELGRGQQAGLRAKPLPETAGNSRQGAGSWAFPSTALELGQRLGISFR